MSLVAPSVANAEFLYSKTLDGGVGWSLVDAAVIWIPKAEGIKEVRK